TAVSLRRLAPVLPILVNNKAVASAYLSDGDCVTIGPIEIVMTIPPSDSAAGGGTMPAHVAKGEQQLREQREQVEVDRALWNRRREEIEAECRSQAEGLQEMVQRLKQQEQELAAARVDVEERERTWRTERDELDRQSEESLTVRRELAEIKQQLYQRY